MIDSSDAARKLIAGYRRSELGVVELRETGHNITVSMEPTSRGHGPCFKINWPGCGDKSPTQSRAFGQALRLAEDICDKAEVLWSLFSNDKTV